MASTDQNEVMAPPAGEKHRWTFFRAAGVVQPALRTAEDVRHLKDLPEELWTILSCPSKNLRFDQKTLELMDSDKDCHVRVRELKTAVEWMCRRMADPADLFLDSEEVPLASFAATDEGRQMAAAAKLLLESIGKGQASSFTLADVMARKSTFLAAPFNGDGVIPPTAATDPAVAKLLGEMVRATGGAADRSGAQGITKDLAKTFYEAVEAHLAWLARGVSEASTLLPLGDATAGASAAIEAVRAKVEDYFMRCRLAAFDDAAATPLNVSAAGYAAVSAGDIAAQGDAIAAFPLSHVAAGRPLPLTEGVNPAWSASLSAFAKQAAGPLLGREVSELTEADWRQVLAGIAPYQGWRKAMAGSSVASLGEARLLEIRADEASRAAIDGLLGKDIERASDIAQLDDLERFTRFHANLNRLFRNFVNFSDYFDPRYEEIFRAGRLYIDGRVCHLCFHVENLASHSMLAAASKMYLVYCEITRSHTNEKRMICATVTSGLSGSLWVGRHGIFYDREEKDWEAVILKIADAPVSLKEAFWYPWSKMAEMLGEQLKKILSSKQDAMLGAASKQVGAIGVPAAKAPPPQPKFDTAVLASSVAAIGIAIGVIGSAIGGFVSMVMKLSPWKSLLGVVVIFLLVSGPSVALAWFKLRARDLGPVLNACGWAVNKKLKMTLKLGAELTHAAKMPKGAKIQAGDPYAERHVVRKVILGVVLLAGLLAFAVWRGWIPTPWTGRSTAAPCETPVVQTQVAPTNAPAVAPAK